MANIIEIQDINAPELRYFTSMTEAQLRADMEMGEGIFIAESPKVIRTAISCGYAPLAFLMERRHIEGQAADILNAFPDIPCYTASREMLAELTGYTLTRGVLCAMKRSPLPAPAEICRDASRIAIAESVCDSTNIGALFRSAAALGIDALLLSPDCCDPLCRRAVRVSMGTVFNLPWCYMDNWYEGGIAELQKLGFKVAAMALTDKAISLADFSPQKEDKIAIVMGTEGTGLRQATIDNCDLVLQIPMQHNVDSLNVAAAAAVAFWQLRK